MNPATGDYSPSYTDSSVATYGPPLDFTRTYDSALAQSQSASGAPGPLGYGWTDNYATSLTTTPPMTSNYIYTASLGGLDTNHGSTASLSGGITTDATGDVYVADTLDNRIQELAATNHTQWGISMTSGNVYTIAGDPSGTSGYSGDTGLATSAKMWGPQGIALDSSGDLLIADDNNGVIRFVAASNCSSSCPWGLSSTTTGDIYTIAGGGSSYGDNGVTASAAEFAQPVALAIDSSGNLFIADTASSYVYILAASSCSSSCPFGLSTTADDVYKIAGNGTQYTTLSGTLGDGGAATSGEIVPNGIAVDSSGNIYIANENTVQFVASANCSTGCRWGLGSTTAGDVYTVAGTPSSIGSGGDRGPATSAILDNAQGVAIDDAGSSLYIADAGDNVVFDVPDGNYQEWGVNMSADYIYVVAGNGSPGNYGDGGPALAAGIDNGGTVAVDSHHNLYVAQDFHTSAVRVVFAASGETVPLASTSGAATVTEEDGSQATFLPESSSSCPSPYQLSGGSGSFCTLGDTSASLSQDSGTGDYTFTTHPYMSYTYNSSGRLLSESGPGGASLSITYNSPTPGSGHCPSAAASCETVTSASGRALTIGWSATGDAGTITSVTDPLGHATTYAYTSNNLTSMTDPMSNVTSYTYDSSNSNVNFKHDLLTTTNPNGQSGGPDAGHHLVLTYESAGRVSSETDPQGHETDFSYAIVPGIGTGATTVTDPDGNETVYSYGGNVLTSIEYDHGTSESPTWTYTPDPNTLLDDSVTNPDSQATSYTYDSSGNIITMTNAFGNVTTYKYNSFDEQTCVAEPLAAGPCSSLTPPAAVSPGGTISPPSSAPPIYVTFTLYDTDGNLIYKATGDYAPYSSTAAQSRTTYDLYNGNDVTIGSADDSCNTSSPSTSLPCATINADAVVTQLAYDTNGDLSATATPDGNSGGEIAKSTYTYDANGELTAVVSPDGNISGANAGNYTTSTTYNNDGATTEVSVGNGAGHTVTPRVTDYGYDGDGNQTSMTDPRGKVTNYTFNANDEQTLVTNPDSKATLTCYDGDGNVAETVPAVGVTANSLTPSSCPTSYPSGYGDRLATDATTTAYDGLGEKTTVTTPAPAGLTGYETTTYAHDAAGRITSITAPPTTTTSGAANDVTAYTYDAIGELSSTTAGSGTSTAATTSYCYDPNGNKIAEVSPDGNVSGIAYCNTSSPYGTSSAYQTSYNYDSLGLMAYSSTPDYQNTNYTYDPAGNLATTTDPNGVTKTNTFTPLNQLASVSYSDTTHGVTYTYDANGSRTSMTDGTGTTTTSYDGFGELTSQENGSGATVSYSYNPNGNVTGITYPLGSGATWASTDSVTYGYDNASQLTSVTDFNGTTSSITNSADGLPTAVGLGSSGDSINTIYDATDAPSSITLANSSTLQAFAYSYEPSGAIASETDTPSSSLSPASYSYDAQSRVTQMTPGSGSPLTYAQDASGNLTTLPSGASGTYDNAGQLSSSTLAGTTTNYTYDSDGNRTGASIGGTSTMSSTYNGASELTSYSNAAADMTTAAYNGDGVRSSATTTPSGGSSSTQNFVWNTTTSVPQLLMDSTYAYIYGPGSTPIAEVNISSGTLQYLVSDMLGSVRGVVSSSGSLTATTAYDAWGNPETTGGLTGYTSFGFAGGYTDPTGLLYLINRYYDSTTGQFIGVDPLINQTGQAYVYTGDDPVNGTDPTGMRCHTRACSERAAYVNAVRRRAAAALEAATAAQQLAQQLAADIYVNSGSVASNQQPAVTYVKAESLSIDTANLPATPPVTLKSEVVGIYAHEVNGLGQKYAWVNSGLSEASKRLGLSNGFVILKGVWYQASAATNTLANWIFSVGGEVPDG